MKRKSLKTLLFNDVDERQFWQSLKLMLFASFASAFIIIVDGGFFSPLVFGAFLVYQFYEEKQRIKYITFLVPFVLLVIFITSGGAFYVIELKSSLLLDMISGMWASFVVLLCIWLFFKVKLKVVHFVLLIFTIPVAYLVRAYIFKGMSENTEFFFFFLYNVALSFSLCLLLTQNNYGSIINIHQNLKK